MSLGRPRLTAQWVSSDLTAVLAYSCRWGAQNIAVLLHTTDGGRTWHRLPWERTWWDRMHRWGYPTWPPETVSDVSMSASGLVIVFRDEWVPFEPGGESLWRARRAASGAWWTARLRAMRYEEEPGDPALPVPSVELCLPPWIAAPPPQLLLPPERGLRRRRKGTLL